MLTSARPWVSVGVSLLSVCLIREKENSKQTLGTKLKKGEKKKRKKTKVETQPPLQTTHIKLEEDG